MDKKGYIKKSNLFFISLAIILLITTVMAIEAQSAIENKGEDKEKNLDSDKVNAGITGGAIWANLLSGGQITIIITMLTGLFIVFIIVKSRTPLRLKKKWNQLILF